MATNITKKQFKEILLDSDITRQDDLLLFQTLYSFENHQATATQVAKILGYKNKVVANGQIGRLGKRIAKKYDIQLSIRQNKKYKFWDLFFDGWTEGTFFVWKLKDELTSALEELSLTGDFHLPEELPVDTSQKFLEGIKRIVTVNSYERNPVARQRCVDHWGTTCSVCNFDFEKKYGQLGKGFVHVHHLTPISKIGDSYEVDPINDLRPVCPNCHTMLHRETPTLTIEVLKTKIVNTAKL